MTTDRRERLVPWPDRAGRAWNERKLETVNAAKMADRPYHPGAVGAAVPRKRCRMCGATVAELFGYPPLDQKNICRECLGILAFDGIKGTKP